MMSEPKKLKGILKAPKSSDVDAAASDEVDKKREEAKEIAIRHAQILQQQKDLQTTIFDAINTLTEFPLSGEAPFSSSNPAPSDVAQFKALVRLFQPSDYDDLIEERNIMDHCGYALCGQRRRHYPRGGEFKFVNKNRGNFDIMRREELEKWCSEACARRALYIKVQLNETAAWERVGLPDLPLELLGEDEKDPADSDDDGLAKDASRLKLEDKRKAAQDSTALALERGDVGQKSAPTKRKMNVTIREKVVSTPAKAPELPASTDAEDESHRIVEGHKIRFGNPSVQKSQAEEEEA
jgi:hypothetical protein